VNCAFNERKAKNGIDFQVHCFNSLVKTRLFFINKVCSYLTRRPSRLNRALGSASLPLKRL
jgi:hypothetical protein